MVDTWVPKPAWNAQDVPARSIRLVFACNGGVFRVLWYPTSAVSTVFPFLFFWFGSRQGVLTESVYTESVYTERLMETVWTPTIKNTVMVMLYPPYTPSILIATSLQAAEDTDERQSQALHV